MSEIAVAVAGGLIGLAGMVYATVVGQRNRRADKTDQRRDDVTNARVQDSKNALDAWMAISAANAQQIASLTGRVDALQHQLRSCEEDTVPRLEATVVSQQTVIGQLHAQIDGHETTIAALQARIETMGQPT